LQRPAAQGSSNVSGGQAAPQANNSKTGLIVGALVVVAVAIGAFMFLGKGESAPASSNSAPAERSNSTAANQPVTAKDELNILLGLVRDGRWKEATPKIQQLKSLSQVAAGDRQAATAPYTQGAQLLTDNDLQGAATAFEKAISADASFGAPRFGLARSYSRSGKLDTAAAVLVDGLLIAPDSGDGWLAAAEVFAENNKDEAANASLKLALHLAQNRSTAMQFLSNANETVKSAKFKKIIEVAMPTLSGVPSK
jgi:predicted Zn-dependent protease